MIVGIDLGITAGIAILDTRGNILNLSSKKEATKNDIIKHVLKFGEPLIIASDVNPLPRGIKKLSSSLGSHSFYPKVSMSYKEKSKIIDDYKERIKDSHQKDALASALRAFKNYHSTFLKVEEILKKIGRKDVFEEVVKRVWKRRTESIVDAAKETIKRERNEE